MKYTSEELLKRINDTENGDYKCLTKEFPEGIKTRVTLKHKCGYKYECKLKGFLNENKSRCPKCKETVNHSTKRVTEKDFIERIKNETGNEYSYISGFKNTHSKCLLVHNKCKNKFEVTPHMFLGAKKSRCPHCANKNRGKYAIKENYLENLLKERFDGNEYKWLEEYKNNNKIKHGIEHNCGFKYKVRPNDFQQGYGCPVCSKTNINSKGERKIRSILDSLDVEYFKEYTFEDCRYKRLLPFDFKLETDDGRIILIEYDGEQHFERCFYSENYELQKLRDKIKDEYCKMHDNIDLYRISYKDYDNLEKIIKDIIDKYE